MITIGCSTTTTKPILARVGRASFIPGAATQEKSIPQDTTLGMEELHRTKFQLPWPLSLRKIQTFNMCPKKYEPWAG